MLDLAPLPAAYTGFSALQRAENSSINFCSSLRFLVALVSVLFSEPKIPQSATLLCRAVVKLKFQCSSASRKFLNCVLDKLREIKPRPFQCSSASRKFLNRPAATASRASASVSVLFSEPKIPQ